MNKIVFILGYCCTMYTMYAEIQHNITRNPFNFNDDQLEKKTYKIETQLVREEKEDTDWQVLVAEDNRRIIQHQDGTVREIRHKKSPST